MNALGGINGSANKYVMKVWNGRSDKPTNAETTEFKTKKEAVKEAKTLRKIYGFSSTFPMHIVIYKKGSPDKKNFY